MPSNAQLNDMRRVAQANSQTLRLNHLDLDAIRRVLKTEYTFSVVIGCKDCGTICCGNNADRCKCCRENHASVAGTRINTFARDGRKGHEPIGTVDEILTREPPGKRRTA